MLRKQIKGYLEGVISTNEPLLVNKGSDGVVIISLSDFNRLTYGKPVCCSLPEAHSSIMENAAGKEYVDVDLNEL